MSLGWALATGGLVIATAIAFCILGFMLGDDVARYGMHDERLKVIEAERQMHDLTRQAFVAMAEAAEQAQGLPKRNPNRRPPEPPRGMLSD